MSTEIERVQRLYNQGADRFDQGMAWADRWLFTGGRQWVCSQAHGDVLEIAVGTGRNLPYYAADVRLAGVDVSDAMLALARQRAVALGRQVDLRLGDA